MANGLLSMNSRKRDLLAKKRKQEELMQANALAQFLGVNGNNQPEINEVTVYGKRPPRAPVEDRSISAELPPANTQAITHTPLPVESPPNMLQRAGRNIGSGLSGLAGKVGGGLSGIADGVGSGLSSAAGGIGKRLNDPAYMANLAMAFNTMRLNPDPNIATYASGIREQERSKKSANQTVQYLRAQGREDLANIVEQDPTMASEVLKSMLGTQHMSKVGAIQTDPITGQQYFTEYDPNTGQTRRVDVEGAIGETAAQKAAREVELATLQAGRNAASARGRDYFDRATTIGESIEIMKSARDLAVNGVLTGITERYLPAVDANTQMFRNLQKDLGITVINSATFGALSEKELDLATTKDIPSSLKGQELLDYLDAKIAAQNKMYREMNRKARRMQSGITLGQYMEELQEEIDENHRILAAYPQGDPDMTYTMWSQMSGNDRKAYIEAEE